MTTIVVITDLRAVPILAALNIARAARRREPTKLVASERLFYNNEYADYTPVLWKLMLLFILKLFFSLELIRKEKQSELSSSDQLGLISSLYSITNDSGATSLKYPDLYTSMLELSLGAKELVNYLRTIKNVMTIYVFNGRTASSYLISKYGHESKLNTYYYEYAWHCDGYRLFPYPPHASGDMGKIAMRFRKEACISIPSLHNKARAYKREKLNNQFSLTNTNTTDKNYDVAIFLGSDHEYTAVDPAICNIEWNGNIPFIKRVIHKYGTNVTYAVRCHPNQATDKSWHALITDISCYIRENEAKIDLYGPDSKLSSYDLMKRSKIVVTDLSSIAVDAVLLGYDVDIFGNTDLNYFLNSENATKMMSAPSKADYVAQIFALYPQIFVIRFNRIEKQLCRLFFYVHRTFEKIRNATNYR